MVAAARAAQPGWRGLGFERRGALLREVRRRLIAQTDRVVATIVAETGKPVEAALFSEVAYAAKALTFWARRTEGLLSDHRIAAWPPRPGRRLIVSYVPRGVVGIIGPWNYPLTTSFGDCIPALAAGNAVVLKPSELTPRTSLLMAEIVREAGVPEDVFGVVVGGAETGATLVDHVDFVSFTGSTSTGRAVMRRAAETLTPVSLELGGKDPLIVLADADVERAARAAVLYGFGNAGQTCIAVERVYVEAPVHDAFVEAVLRATAELRTGAPGGPGTVDVGPLLTEEVARRTVEQVRDAVEKGARALTRGVPPGSHPRLHPPTVLLGVDESMSVLREETFGPLLPIRRVRDAEEAVRLANASPYGLAASVFAGDVRRGEAVARRLEVGACCVNDAQTNFFELELPLGGTKASGFGVRHGASGVRKFCVERSLVVLRRPPARGLHRLPYRARRTRLVRALLRLAYR